MIKPFTLQEIAKYFGGQLFGPDVLIASVCTDTRSLQAGQLFIALKGERFNAHDYLGEALDKGAKALVIAQSEAHKLPSNRKCSAWHVDDTMLALGQLAQYQRDFFVKPLIAITGSSGKTSVKGMVESIFSSYIGREKVFATQGNLNNHIGVPLSLLAIEPIHEYAIIEMGASAKGEIGYLSELSKPTVAIINNVMPAHVEGFGSVDAIAVAKGEIYKGLKQDGVALVNIDDYYAQYWLDSIHQERKILFSPSSQNAQADVYAKEIALLANGCYSFVLVCGEQEFKIELNVLGRHNVANAVAASACAYALNVDGASIVAGLKKFVTEKGRLRIIKVENNLSIIDDTYNANPGSMKAAIDVLTDASSNSIFIMGDMSELGDSAIDEHRKIGEYARKKGVRYLLTYGAYSQYAAEAYGGDAKHFKTMELLINDLKKLIVQQSVILVKGSRSSKMERVVQALTPSGGDHAGLVC
jgi:UDP-N-acetylmuramoyl-tripeptide--D-alanyl-D-alanine ligase